MSLKSLEEQRNTGIRFFKDDEGNVTFTFVKLNDLPKDMASNVKELKIGNEFANKDAVTI